MIEMIYNSEHFICNLLLYNFDNSNWDDILCVHVKINMIQVCPGPKLAAMNSDEDYEVRSFFSSVESFFPLGI